MAPPLVEARDCSHVKDKCWYNHNRRDRYPTKEVELALRYAEERGWLVVRASGHTHVWTRTWTYNAVGGAKVNTFEFTLVFDLPSGELSDEILDAFYATGGDDALFGQSAGVFDADFARQSSDILEAIVSAIDDIETAGVGAAVLRVEPDDLVSIADIARRMGRTNEGIRLLINGQRGPGGFPAPATRLGTGRSRVWRWADVVEWFTRYEGDRATGDEARYWSVIALVNDELRQRACARRMDRMAIEVRAALQPALERGCSVASRAKALG
jgi:hypothetical protein